MKSNNPFSDDDGVFLFRRRYEVARPGTERLECVEERVAIADFLDFLEAAGPGVILVGILPLPNAIAIAQCKYIYIYIFF